MCRRCVERRGEERRGEERRGEERRGEERRGEERRGEERRGRTVTVDFNILNIQLSSLTLWMFGILFDKFLEWLMYDQNQSIIFRWSRICFIGCQWLGKVQFEFYLSSTWELYHVWDKHWENSDDQSMELKAPIQACKWTLSLYTFFVKLLFPDTKEYFQDQIITIIPHSQCGIYYISQYCDVHVY